MTHGDNPILKHQDKQKMLDELESLSRLLDEDLGDELEPPARPVPEDIPVLKSFVDDVPVLNERIAEEPAPASITPPQTQSNSPLDTSFLDKDPLDISNALHQHHQTAPAPTVSKPSPPPATATPPAAAATGNTPAANRSPPASKGENPFLPKSTLDKIRENHANDASAELRKLIQNNPRHVSTFDLAPNSREYQQLRQKASQMVNDVIRAHLPRLEAELRLKLEQEVDRMFKDMKSK